MTVLTKERLSTESKAPNGYLTKKEVAKFVGGFTTDTISNWTKKKGFPNPLNLSKTCQVYRIQEVIDWMESHSHKSNVRENPCSFSILTDSNQKE